MKLFLALLLLHLVTAARYHWEGDAFALSSFLRPNLDLLIVLAVYWTGARALRRRRLWTALSVVAVLFVPLYRFGDSAMPAFFGKAFEPFDDVTMLDGLVHLLVHQWTPLESIGKVLGIALAVALAAWLLFRTLACTLRIADSGRALATALLIAQAIVAATWLDSSIERKRETKLVGPSMFGAAAEDFYDFIKARGWRYKQRFEALSTVAIQASKDAPRTFERLERADVLVIFIESYGRALFRGDSKPGIAKVLARFEAQLSTSGHRVASAWTTPSIRGGNSTIAHAEFLTGVRIETQRVFELMLASKVEALPKLLQARGYRTINVHPATVLEKGWPEGERFFGFDKNHFEDSFDYPKSAHRYHWGGMHDQFALDWVRRHELSRDEPIFMLYASLVSHAPFSMIPPYLDDWSKVVSETEWAPAKTWPITWGNYVGHPQVEAAYLDSIRYSFETIAGFVANLERSSLVIVLGDHQPPGVGRMSRSDPSFDVPLHVIARETRLIEPFLAQGFAKAALPPDTLEPFPLDRFKWRFRRAFSQPR